MRYVEGIDRHQATLFPELLDDYIKDDNPVRFIDAYVESLDPGRLNFTYSETKQHVRKPYNPADMLKLCIYGYLNKIRSSRKKRLIIKLIRKKKDKYEKLEDQLKESGESQLSLTDSDSRMMKTQQGKDVCFNVQIAVDSKHKLIVAHDVTKERHQRKGIYNGCMLQMPC